MRSGLLVLELQQIAQSTKPKWSVSGFRGGGVVLGQQGSAWGVPAHLQQCTVCCPYSSSNAWLMMTSAQGCRAHGLWQCASYGQCHQTCRHAALLPECQEEALLWLLLQVQPARP